jgi:phosphoserine phosphatase RsbU/P
MDNMHEQEHALQCMEVWGGNQAVQSSVRLAGLDVHVYSRPYLDEDGGGDVYYVSSCATGRITRLLVADVSGHGARVAEQARQLRELMRQHVNHLDQCNFVRRMNTQFAENAVVGSFATAIVTTYFAPTSTLALCNAGHPPPLIWRNKTRRWSYLQIDSYNENIGIADVPLGIVDMADYQQFDIDLAPGDRVLCYTDSFPEARAPDGNIIGPDVLLDLIQSVDATDTGTLVERIIRTIETRATIDGDDVTTLLLAPNTASGHITLRSRLMSPLRIAGGIVNTLSRGTLRGLPLPDMRLANVLGVLCPWLERRRK